MSWFWLDLRPSGGVPIASPFPPAGFTSCSWAVALPAFIEIKYVRKEDLFFLSLTASRNIFWKSDFWSLESGTVWYFSEKCAFIVCTQTPVPPTWAAHTRLRSEWFQQQWPPCTVNTPSALGARLFSVCARRSESQLKSDVCADRLRTTTITNTVRHTFSWLWNLFLQLESK